MCVVVHSLAYCIASHQTIYFIAVLLAVREMGNHYIAKSLAKCQRNY